MKNISNQVACGRANCKCHLGAPANARVSNKFLNLMNKKETKPKKNIEVWTWQWTLPFSIWWENGVRSLFFYLPCSAPCRFTFSIWLIMHEYGRENFNNTHFVQIKRKQKWSVSRHVCLDDVPINGTCDTITIWCVHLCRRTRRRNHSTVLLCHYMPDSYIN